MFLNISNHKSQNWPEKEREAAMKWGCIMDLPFSPVRADAKKEEIQSMAENLVREAVRLSPSVCLCKGEYSLTYHVVQGLKRYGIPVVCACSERNTHETVLTETGTVQKKVVFNFVQFREY